MSWSSGAEYYEVPLTRVDVTHVLLQQAHEVRNELGRFTVVRRRDVGCRCPAVIEIVELPRRSWTGARLYAALQCQRRPSVT